MNPRQSHPVVPVVVLLVVVAGSAVAVTAPAGATTQGTNDTDSGALVGTAIAASGESVGLPVGAPDASFDRRFYASVSAVATAYNEEQPDLGFAGGLVTGNVVNLHVTDGDDEAVVSFRLTEDNRITDLRAGPREGAKIRMTTDRETFDRIANADAPGTALGQALDAGEVRVDGLGAASAIVWHVVNALRTIANLP